MKNFFNYGRCLPWHTFQKHHGVPGEYQRAAALMERLTREKAKLDKAVWDLEMGMRAVRIADTDDEFLGARMTLMARVIPEADVLGVAGTFGSHHW